ncbi:hypothetical protein JL720_15193 [Aureococcus anophagefferens]|nr:hypothetical protein JL720_15193 [Aureococcus anophagefferens]
MKVTAKNGAIVRETQGMTSEVVTELACGTLVVVDRHVIIKHKNKDIKRVKITVPNEGWMSAKSLRVSEEKHGAGASRTAIAGNRNEPAKAVVLGYFGARVDLLTAFASHWRDRRFGVLTYVPSPGDDYDERREYVADYVRGADRVVFHALSNNGYAFLNHLFRDEQFAEALKGRAFVVLDSCPEVPKAEDGYRATVVRAVTAMVCQANDEAPDAKHPRYHPEVAKQLATFPVQGHALGGDAIPRWVPLLVVYSEADAVIAHGEIDAYVDSRDDATGILKFSDTPHVTGFAPPARSRRRSTTCSTAYIPQGQALYFANTRLGLRRANTYANGEASHDHHDQGGGGGGINLRRHERAADHVHGARRHDGRRRRHQRRPPVLSGGGLGPNSGVQNPFEGRGNVQQLPGGKGFVMSR